MNTKGKYLLIITTFVLTLILSSVVAAATAGAQAERTIEERLRFLEECLVNVCNSGAPAGPGAFSPEAVETARAAVPTEPPIITEPPVVTEPPIITEPPVVTEAPEKCNQGRGNGPEGCDPGNSNNHNPSNDEGPTNRGGKNVPKP